MSRSFLLAAAALAIGAAAAPSFPSSVAPSVSAAVYRFTGAAQSGEATLNWATPANWLYEDDFGVFSIPGTAPGTTSGTSFDYLFSLADYPALSSVQQSQTAISVNLATTRYANSLTLVGVSEEASGNTLSFTNSALYTNSLTLQHGSVNTTFTGAIYARSSTTGLTITNASGALSTLTFTNTVSATNAQSQAGTLTVDTQDNSDAVVFTNYVSAATLVKNGAGSLTLTLAGNSNARTFGNFDFNGGTVIVKASRIFGGSAATYAPNSVVRLGGGGVNTITMSSTNTTQKVTYANFASLDLAGADLVVNRATTTAFEHTFAFEGTTAGSIGGASTADLRTVEIAQLTNLSIANALSGAGTLLKTGAGTLTLTSAGSTFAALDVRAGTVAAQITANSALGVSASSGTNSGALGGGILTVDGTYTRVELTRSTAAGTPATPIVTLGTGANLTLRNGGVVTVGANLDVKLEAGAVDFCYNAVDQSCGLLDFGTASVAIGGTTFTGLMPNATSKFAGDISFLPDYAATTGSPDVAALGALAGFNLELSGAAAQTLYRNFDNTNDGFGAGATAGAIALAGSVFKTAASTVTLDPSITTFSAAGAAGLTLAAGTFALTLQDQLAAGTVVNFTGTPATAAALPETSPVLAHAATATAGTHNNITVAAGALGTIRLGGDASSTFALNIGAVSFGDAAASLRFENYTDPVLAAASQRFTGTAVPVLTADRVTLANASAVNLDQVWFRGYAPGAALSSSPTAPNEIVPANGYLVTIYDARNETTAASTGTTTWNNPLAWAGDDYFWVPDSPGATVRFESSVTTGTLSITFKGATYTVGNLTSDNTSGIGTAGTYYLDSDYATVAGGRLILDSGDPSAPATITFSTSRTLVTYSSIELRSNLLVDGKGAVHFWSSGLTATPTTGATITENGGSFGITKRNTGTLSFGGKGTYSFSGDIFFEQGSIQLFNITAGLETFQLGTGAIRIIRLDGITVGNSTTGHIIAGYNGTATSTYAQKTLLNPIVFDADSWLTLNAVTLNPATPTDTPLAGTITLYSNASSSAVHAGLGRNLQLSGTGALVLSGSQNSTAYIFRLENFDSTFTGGLTINTRTIIDSGTTGADAVVIGAPAAGKNPLGAGTVTTTSALLITAPEVTVAGTLNISAAGSTGNNSYAYVSITSPLTTFAAGSTVAVPNTGSAYTRYITFTGGTAAAPHQVVFAGGALPATTAQGVFDLRVATGNVLFRADNGVSTATISNHLVVSNGTLTLDPSLTTFTAKQFTVGSGAATTSTTAGGTLRLTLDNQIATPAGGVLLINAGTFDISNLTISLPNASLSKASGDNGYSAGTIILGDSGKLTLAGITGSTNVWGTDNRRTVTIQNSDVELWGSKTETAGVWEWTAPGATYIRFAMDDLAVSTFLTNYPEALTRFNFTGYSTDAAHPAVLVKFADTATYGDYYYLLPNPAAFAPFEWTGAADNTPLNNDALWSVSGNWTIAPDTGSASAYVVFRDLDAVLGDALKTAVFVDLHATVNRITFDHARPFTLREADTGGSLTLAGTGALIENKYSTTTVEVPLIFAAPTTIAGSSDIHFTGTLAGGAQITLAADTDTLLSFSGNSPAFTGGVLWKTGPLRLTGTGTAVLGTGEWLIGEDTDTPSLSLTLGASTAVTTPWTLNAATLCVTTNTGAVESAPSLAGAGTLAPGMHNISVAGTAVQTSGYYNVLRIDGEISGAGGLQLGASFAPDTANWRGRLYLGAANTYSGGTTLDLRDFYIYLGADNALGTGPITLTRSAAGSTAGILASDTTGTDGIRTLDNDIIFSAPYNGDLLLYNLRLTGNLSLASETQTNVRFSIATNYSLIIEGQFADAPDTLAHNLYFSGSGGEVRLNVPQNSFTGSVYLAQTGGTFLIADDKALGTGTIYFNATGSARLGAAAGSDGATTRTLYNKIGWSMNGGLYVDNETGVELVFATGGDPAIYGTDADVIALRPTYTTTIGIGAGDRLTIHKQLTDGSGGASSITLSSGNRAATLVLTNPDNSFSGTLTISAGTLEVTVPADRPNIVTGTTAAAAEAAGLVEAGTAATPIGSASPIIITGTNSKLLLRTETGDIHLAGSGEIFRISGNGATNNVPYSGLFLETPGENRKTYIYGGTAITTATNAMTGYITALNGIAKEHDTGVVSLSARLYTGTTPDTGLIISTGAVRLVPYDTSATSLTNTATLLANAVVVLNGGTLDIHYDAADRSAVLTNVTIKALHATSPSSVDVSGGTIATPVEITLGALNATAFLAFTGWEGDPATGRGKTIIKTTETGVAPGYVYPNVILTDAASVDFANLPPTLPTRAIVSRNDLGALVLLPFNKDYTWDGESGSTLWDDDNWRRVGVHATNESPGTTTGNDGELAVFDSAVLDALGRQMPESILVRPSGVYVGGIEFNLDATDALTLTGGTIYFFTGLADGSPLGSAATLSKSGAGTATIASDIYIQPLGSFVENLTITQDGAGALVFTGQVRGPGSRVTVKGSGTGEVLFLNQNTFTGGFTLDSQSVVLPITGDSVGTPSPSVTSSPLGRGTLYLLNGTLRATDATGALDEARTLANAYVLGDADGASSEIRITGTAPLTLAGAGTLAGSSTLRVAAGSEIILGNPDGSSALADGGTHGTLTAAGAGKVTLNAAPAAGITLAADAGGTLVLARDDPAAPVAYPNAFKTGTTGTITLPSSAGGTANGIEFSGAFENEGTFRVEADAALVGAFALSGSGTVNIATGATLTLRDEAANTFAFPNRLAGGGTLDVAFTDAATQLAFSAAAPSAFTGTLSLERGEVLFDAAAGRALRGATVSVAASTGTAADATLRIAEPFAAGDKLAALALDAARLVVTPGASIRTEHFSVGAGGAVVSLEGTGSDFPDLLTLAPETPLIFTPVVISDTPTTGNIAGLSVFPAANIYDLAPGATGAAVVGRVYFTGEVSVEHEGAHGLFLTQGITALNVIAGKTLTLDTGVADYSQAVGAPGAAAVYLNLPIGEEPDAANPSATAGSVRFAGNALIKLWSTEPSTYTGSTEIAVGARVDNGITYA
ncbi:MAG: autotransporter-associated beta strand repeat-containing protein, partial [Puniceicoccales bacterium]|nr:autotransporter-associated beta strand repeat-containing protein [Puniceicoccales bacterium]